MRSAKWTVTVFSPVGYITKPRLLSRLLSSLLLGFLGLGFVNRSRSHEGDFLLVLGGHVHLEGFRHLDAGLRLVHLQEHTDHPGAWSMDHGHLLHGAWSIGGLPGDGTECGVEHVAVLGGGVHLLGLAVPHPQPPSLVVQTVAAAHQLPGHKYTSH